MGVVVERECSAPVADLWQVTTDWAEHGRFFPLTTMEVPAGRRGLGQRFEATTRLGPVRFRDPMIVTRWDPPGESGRCELRKLGTVLGGSTTLSVEASAQGSLLRWSTDVGPANPLARRLLAPLTRLTAAPLYRHVVRSIVREAERGC